MTPITHEEYKSLTEDGSYHATEDMRELVDFVEGIHTLHGECQINVVYHSDREFAVNVKMKFATCKPTTFVLHDRNLRPVIRLQAITNVYNKFLAESAALMGTINAFGDGTHNVIYIDKLEPEPRRERQRFPRPVSAPRKCQPGKVTLDRRLCNIWYTAKRSKKPP